ncbi:hypothetical protein BD408DRAFT_84394 [Parasitella parasitica]|nr:hypothetical protein BD408DRAFT_84394 [Parasitella parasitica]
MPPKRKTSSNQVHSNKVLKTPSTLIAAATSRRQTRSQTNEADIISLEKKEEVAVEMQKSVAEISTEAVQPSTTPLSAVAARRAAIIAGIFKPEPVDYSENESEQDEDEYLQRIAEGSDVQSATDDDEEEKEEALRDELEEDRVMPSISGAATPNGAVSLKPIAMETIKPRNKM